MFEKTNDEKREEKSSLPKYTLSINVLKRFLSEDELNELKTAYLKNRKIGMTGHSNARFEAIEKPVTREELTCLNGFLSKKEELGKSFTEFEAEIGVPRSTGRNKAVSAAFKILYAIREAGDLEKLISKFNVKVE